LKIFKAIRIKFNLRLSSYATMLVRELTKTSSAFAIQSEMSREKQAPKDVSIA